MNPQTAILKLIGLGMTELQIGKAVGVSQPAISRNKNGAIPTYPVGKALVDLATKKLKKRACCR